MLRTIDAGFAKAIERGQGDRRRAQIRSSGRITATQGFDSFGECDLVIESVIEEMAVKLQLFAELDRATKPSAILATNTSTLPVIDLAMATSRPEQVCGIHFFNPAPADEVGGGRASADSACAETIEGPWRSSRRAARMPSRCRTTPASSSTRCCSRISTTPCACSNAGHGFDRVDRHGDEGWLQLPHGPVRPARPGRSRYLGRDPRDHPRVVRQSRPTPRRRRCSTRSPRATSAARPNRASTRTDLDRLSIRLRCSKLCEVHTGSTSDRAAAEPLAAARAELADENGLCGIGAIWRRARCWPRTAAGSSRCRCARRPSGWWSPDPRGVIPLDGLIVSRSLRRSCRRYEVRFDTRFREVMERCADPGRPHGWITPAFVDAYDELHRLGWAHSVETYLDGHLVGGSVRGAHRRPVRRRVDVQLTPPTRRRSRSSPWSTGSVESGATVARRAVDDAAPRVAGRDRRRQRRVPGVCWPRR